MRKCVTICMVLLGLLFLPSSYALLDLELTQGIAQALPIAIIPFKGGTANVPGDTRLSQVIANDLQHSGEFRVVGPTGLTQLPTTLEQVSYSYWRSHKIDYVLIGSIHPQDGDRYLINFQLVSIYHTDSAAQASKEKKNVLLDGSFTAAQSSLRDVAHQVSDLIYQKLTGVPGIFRTKIAYILIQRFPNRKPVYRLEVADADGFAPQTLVKSSMPLMSPAWSADGQRIAYVSFEGHRSNLYVQNVSTGQRMLVSDQPGINGAPSFSPHGNELALVLSKTANPKIYILNLKTKRLRQLTHGWSIDTEPAFSPDGKFILFTSNRDGKPQIFQYRLADGHIKRLSFSGNYNARASYLPNQHSVIMMHRESGLFGIAKLNLLDDRVQILTQSGSDESPSVAPNGKMVIYAMRYGGRAVLAQVSTDGRIKLRLPAGEGSVQEPAWSPFLNTTSLLTTTNR